MGVGTLKILPDTYAVFWRSGRQQFHADIPATGTPVDAVAAFRAMFPGDTVCSVRDTRGRFLSFKESTQ